MLTGLSAQFTRPDTGAIGIFDSGCGGLSVLRHIRSALPLEDLTYFSDSRFAPYGDRSETLVIARALAIADFFVHQGAKALVVACNTATAAAIDAIRCRHPTFLVVGVEPGLKPAAAQSLSRVVGVLATSGTLASSRFRQLQAQITASTDIQFLLQPCPGLADQIEKGELRSPATARLLQHLITPLLLQNADTLVLGCTHYPFVQPLIESVIAAHLGALTPGAPGGDAVGMVVGLIDTGAAVARQLESVLHRQNRLTLRLLPLRNTGHLRLYTTGSISALSQSMQRLLGLDATVTHVTVSG